MSVNLGTAYAELVLNSTGFTAGLAAAETQLQTFKNQASLVASGLTGVGSALTKAGTTLATTVTAPVLAAGAAALKTGADFDAGMSKVAAISGATGEDLERLREKAREMGATTKFTATESAEALNYMAMAGWKTEDMLDGLEGIMYLAAASGEDLGRTSDIVTDALTAFGMEAKDSSHFADVLAAAAANSNTNVAMMGETFKYAAPTAGALGYSIEDVAVAIGLMGNSGIKASRAGTSLNNIFTRMATQPKQAAAAMDRLGVSLYDDEGRMYSFMEIMEQLRGSFGHINMPLDEFNKRVEELDDALEDGSITQAKYDEQLEELIKQAYGAEGAEKARAAAMLAGQRGMAGLLAIVNATEEDFNSLTEAIYTASEGEGMAAKQAAIMMDNLQGKVTILKSAIQELAIEIYEVILPHVDALVSKAQELVTWFQQLSVEQKEQIVRWAGIAAAIGPALLVVGKLLTSLGGIISTGVKISTWLGSVAKAFGLISTGAEGAGAAISAVGASFAWVAAVVAAVVGLGVALKKLYDEGGQFTESVNKFKDVIVKDFEALVERLKQIFENFKAAIKPVIDTIKNSFKFDEVDSAMSKLVDAFQNLYNTLKPVVQFIVNAIEVVLGPLILGFLSTVSGVVNGIISALGPLIDTIADVINIFADCWKTAKALLKGIVTGDFTEFKAAINTLFGDIKKLVSDLIVTVKTYISGFLEGFSATLAGFTSVTLSDIAEFFAGIWRHIERFFTITIPDAFSKIKEAIVTFFTVTIPEEFDKFVVKVGEFIDSVIAWFDQLPYKIGYAVGYALETIKEWGVSLWDWATTEVPRLIEEGIIFWYVELPQMMWECLLDAIAKVKQWGIDLMTWAKAEIPKFIDSIIDFFKELPGKVWEWVTNTYEKIKEWGTEIIDKGKEISGDFVDGIIEFVKELPEKVWDFLKELPDKVLDIGDDLYEAGRDIIEQLWEGLKDIWNDVSDWFEGVWDNVRDFLRGIEDGMNDAQELSAGSHADGLSYVPYNGYKATLHEGERVLTKNEAQGYGGRGGTAYTINIYSPKQVDPYEANKIFKNTVRQLEEGFA